ncbi:MAG: type II secretion system F family protein [Kiritimatiellae bacterium]|nr:type II secretion system F family protein [Kiritimatiellia bacterium]
MKRFEYVAADASGQEQRGLVEANDMAEAQLALRQHGLTPRSLVPEGARPGSKKKKGGGLNMELKIPLPKFLRGKVKTKDLTVLTRQLATLVDSGLPLLRGLRILAKQATTPAVKEVLQKMCEAVEGGSNFSEALAQHPKTFDQLYVNMAKAGEAGGSLNESLGRLADMLEKGQKLKSKVKSAMTYPTVVLCIALGITAFLMATVIPQFEKLFKDMLGKNAQLPAITQFVVGISNNFVTYAVPIVFGVVALVFLIRMAGKTAKGRYAIDYVKLKAPVFGEIMRKGAIARSTRTLGTLMSSGVPVLQALDIVRDTSGNAVIAKAYQDIHDAVKEGENMTPPMEASKQFPPMVVSMVDVGEETGSLPDMLTRVATTYDGEVDDAVNAMTSIIEPIMIVFLAGIVGTIVIAMFSPLMGLLTKLGG